MKAKAVSGEGKMTAAIANKIIRKTKGDYIFEIVNCGVLGLCALLVLYPLYLIVIASISDPYAMLRGEILLYPKDVLFIGYEKLLQNRGIWIAYRNTFIYTTVGTIINLFLTMMAGYALTRSFPGKKFFNLYFIFIMFFSGGLIPTFLQVKNLGLYDNPLVMVVLGAISVWNVIIARSYIKNNIPEELYEATVMDGGSYYTCFFRIVLPLSKAIIGVLAVYYAVSHWNEFMRGLIYLKNRSYYPFQVVLRELLTSLSSNVIIEDIIGNVPRLEESIRTAEVVKYCAIVISTLPVLTLYMFLQKYFVKGVMIGSLKG